MIELATRCMLGAAQGAGRREQGDTKEKRAGGRKKGESLRDMGFGTGLYKQPPYVAVKVPVFSFEKLGNVDTQLGPEMKSTGEVLGIASTREEALYKGMRAAGYKMKKTGGIFISVRDRDKAQILHVAHKFARLGFKIYATGGTASKLKSVGLDAISVGKIYESENNILPLIESGKISYVISTSTKGRNPDRDSVKIRRKAVERSVPCLTSVDTADVVADCLMSKYWDTTIELVDINKMRPGKKTLRFTKIQTCGNDYIYFNCLDYSQISDPESLSIRLSDRHIGIGGDGMVLIEPSDVADASVRIYNPDGTMGGVCGNALRCVCKYLYDEGIIRKQEMHVEMCGITIRMLVSTTGSKVSSVTTDMGKVEFLPEKIPVKLDGKKVVGRPVSIADGEYAITCLSLGNPYCVVFCDDIHTLDLNDIGPKFENDPIFPDRVNTMFALVLDSTTLLVRVWERGNGETQACGTGACAAAIAAVENGYSEKDTDITVKLPGGDLVIRYSGDRVFMTGSSTKCFDGTIEI